MNKQEFAQKMTEHEQQFDELWSKIVTDTNDFIRENGNDAPGNIGRTDRFIDGLCLAGAWISDRLNGFNGTPQMGNYNKSLTKKIRKGLGYTL